jgi:hypothetical protein
MKEIANTTRKATTAASATYYYARIGNPRTWKQVSRG